MNYIKLYYTFINHLINLLRRIYFYIFQKPIYSVSYNSAGNKFVCHGILRNSSIFLTGNDNKVIIGHGVVLNNTKIRISGINNTLLIKDRVIFHNGKLITLENEGNTLEIGEDTDFQGCSFIVREYGTKVIVGNNCMFSANIFVRNGDSHTIYNAKNEKINPAKDVIIGDRVWIGHSVTILKGSIIENDSIVGANSVVSGKHIPSGSVAVGNPAKVIKQDIHWGRERTR